MTYHEERVKEALKMFYRELCLKYNGDENKTSQGIASADHIAETLNMNVSDVEQIMNQLVKYGITERQGGAYVI